MTTIVSNTYEIIEKIGSGGGGIVYLARHLRLDKLVVLKADKRTISAKPEALRREVDVLKNLSHTYIPQVYDFIYENGVVYTVMDYVEGESLDKPLKRGERFSQPQIIEWACELLDAVKYLHSRPPYGILHSDIKPANIMLTPQGDIRLIDFNIALALGEEGAVKVGHSFGYASPEHYGSDNLAFNNTIIDTLTDKTYADHNSAPSSTGSVTRKKGTLLDVRSDIYSIGATLYHLLSGRRPEKDATQVTPLGTEFASPQISDIIKKAMQPNPDDRFQTAAEMLYAFEHLYENDFRTKRLKRISRVSTAFLIALFLVGGGTTAAGMRLQEREQATAREAAEQMAESERLAKENERIQKEIEQNAKDALEKISLAQDYLNKGEASEAKKHALVAIEKNTQYNALAQKVLTDALGVYDLNNGYKPSKTVELPSDLLDVALSPSGTYAAVIYPWSATLIDTSSGETIVEYPVFNSAMSRICFANDSILVFAGDEGIKAINTQSGDVLWSDKAATYITCAADGKKIAAVFRDKNEASIYEADTGNLLQTVSFGKRKQYVAANDLYVDLRDNLFQLNSDGSLLAVSFSDGSVFVYDTLTGQVFSQVFDENDYTHFEGGFFGDWLILSASGNAQKPYFAVVNMDDDSLGYDGFVNERFLVQADETGVYLASGNTLVRFDPVTREQTELAYTTEKDITSFCCAQGYSIVAAEKTFYVFDHTARLLSQTETDYGCDFVAVAGRSAVVGSRDTPYLRILAEESHPDALFAKYDHRFSHIEARVSGNRERIMVFDLDRFQIYARDGEMITEVVIPDKDEIYDHQFRREGEESQLEVFYYDGTVRKYNAYDGTLLGEERGELYDKSLEEDFYTERYHIHSVPHEAPQVFKIETGELVGTLEKEDGLTYVTQMDDYIIAEYVNTIGERYGVLMNNKLEVLATLPDLCDCFEGILYFDYKAGEIRCCKLYDLNELIEMAE